MKKGDFSCDFSQFALFWLFQVPRF
jgi:hypothetical protein